MIAGAILALRDSQKRERDIRRAPMMIALSGVGAGAALTAALATLFAILLKWRRH